MLPIDIPATIFREYNKNEKSHSDRSARDRARHRQLIKENIKKNLPDILSEEAIIGRDKDRIIKVPVRGVREFRFVYGDNQPRVGTGNGDSQEGQVAGKTDSGQDKQGQGKGQAGQGPGEDIYITEISLDELLQYLFEELKLPNLDKTNLKEIIQKSRLKKDGYKKVGIPVRLARKKTAIQRIKRKKSMGRHNDPMEDCTVCTEGYVETLDAEGFPYEEKCVDCEGTGKVEKRVRFRKEDLRYSRMKPDPKPQSNASIIFIMDTSGSITNDHIFLIRSFYFLLYSFIKERYDRAVVTFIAHDSSAKEVNEEQFFRRESSGGTIMSSGLLKAEEIIVERYSPALWNNYVFAASDGDNYSSDNPKTIEVAKRLAEICSLVGYVEVIPGSSSWSSSTILTEFKTHMKDISNFKQVKLTNKDEVWPKIKEILTIEDEVKR